MLARLLHSFSKTGGDGSAYFHSQKDEVMAKKLYVGNLPFTITEEELTELFSQYGEIKSVSVIKDQYSGRPRGFAFVEMENADEAANALNGKDFGGRALTVNEAREKEPRAERGGTGGGARRAGAGKRW